LTSVGATPSAGEAATREVAGVLAVLLVDHLPRHRAWAWLRLAQGPSALRDLPGLRFAKVMGSGEGGGFRIRPSATHQGLLCVFDELSQAQSFLASPLTDAYRERARQWWSGLMAVSAARGSWDGCAWAATPAAALVNPGMLAPSGTGAMLQAEGADAPVAVLTRASIRPHKAMSFWRRAPGTERALAESPGCELAIGLGEAPLLRQCTFSVWRDTPSMEGYARGGAHGRAAQFAWREGHFSESLFVRMRVLASAGAWPMPGGVHVG